MIRPLIACDLGSRPALVLVTGTENCPKLLGARRFSRWDGEKIVGQIKEWVGLHPGIVLWCEETFSHGTKRRGYLRDVGRLQEHQAGYLEGILSGVCEVRRVPPVNDAEAQVAWIQFGRPEEGKGSAGEHVRDALGVGLKGLIRQGEHKELVREGRG